MSFNNLSFDSVFASLQPKNSVPLPFTNHYLRVHFQPIKDSQGDRVTVTSLLNRVVDQRRFLSISHQKLMKERRSPVKLQRMIEISPPILDLRYKILDDCEEPIKQTSRRESNQEAEESVQKRDSGEGGSSEGAKTCEKAFIPVHNLNRETALNLKLNFQLKTRSSPMKWRPKSELRVRREGGQESSSRSVSPNPKIEARSRKTDTSSSLTERWLKNSIQIKGSKCKFTSKLPDSSDRTEERGKTTEPWITDYGKALKNRSELDSKSMILHQNLRKYTKGQTPGLGPRVFRKPKGAASFSVFDMDGLVHLQKVNGSQGTK